MSFDPVTAALNIGGKLIDKLFPDPEQRDRAKLDLIRLQQDGHFKEVELQMSAIIAEAKSADPWTSRARPSFLYVMYIMILFSVPMGIVSAFRPDMAMAVAGGMNAWLKAIPTELYTVFGVGYTGYTFARSVWDKPKLK